MKIAYCTCDVSILAELTDLLEKLDLCDYQILEKALSKTRAGHPRLNTPVWPGHNAAVLIQMSEERKMQELMEAVNGYNARTEHADERIALCGWQVTDFIMG